jgi:hypothetical protein
MIDFYFYDYDNSNYLRNFTIAGFNETDITFNNLNYKNSFFIWELYDSYNEENQRFIYKNYYNRLPNINFSGLIFINSEFKKILIPNYFINEFSGDTITGYSKFMFFNGETGKYHLFYNKLNENIENEERYYSKTIINKNNKTLQLDSLEFYEEINAVTYLNKINNEASFNLFKETYPSGFTFNYKDGKYYLIE